MKMIKNILSAVIVCVLLITMTGCSKYNFYNDWSEAGAKITKDHIFVAVTLEEVQEKIEADETFALLYTTSESQTGIAAVETLQNQAEYLGFEDEVIYFLDAADYISSSKKRKEVREAINMHDPIDSIIDAPVIITYVKGVVDVDTSDLTDTKTKKFIGEDGTIQYLSLASYIFRELLAE